jgi:hypothetical protein
LGYDRFTAQNSKKINSDVQYSAGFKLPSGVDTKRQNSQRKQTRASRKKLAAVTREMQNEQATKSSSSPAQDHDQEIKE